MGDTKQQMGTLSLEAGDMPKLRKASWALLSAIGRVPRSDLPGRACGFLFKVTWHFILSSYSTRTRRSRQE